MERIRTEYATRYLEHLHLPPTSQAIERIRKELDKRLIVERGFGSESLTVSLRNQARLKKTNWNGNNNERVKNTSSSSSSSLTNSIKDFSFNIRPFLPQTREETEEKQSFSNHSDTSPTSTTTSASLSNNQWLEFVSFAYLCQSHEFTPHKSSKPHTISLSKSQNHSQFCLLHSSPTDPWQLLFDLAHVTNFTANNEPIQSEGMELAVQTSPDSASDLVQRFFELVEFQYDTLSKRDVAGEVFGEVLSGVLERPLSFHTDSMQFLCVLNSLSSLFKQKEFLTLVELFSHLLYWTIFAGEFYKSTKPIQRLEEIQQRVLLIRKQCVGLFKQIDSSALKKLRPYTTLVLPVVKDVILSVSVNLLLKHCKTYFAVQKKPQQETEDIRRKVNFIKKTYEIIDEIIPNAETQFKFPLLK